MYLALRSASTSSSFCARSAAQSVRRAVAVAAYAYYLRACVRRREGQISETKETIS